MSEHPDRTQVLERVPTGVFIGGQWRDATGGGTFAVEDPATQETLTEVADGQPEDATAALDAAVEAAPGWAATPPRERGEILRRAWSLLVEHTDELALLMTLEMGKSVTESKAEVAYGAEFFRWFSEQAVRIEGRFSRAPATSERLLTMKQPVGPCLLITPWNFPLAMGTRKIGPAIAAGCTMVLKPAQLTPLTSLRLAELLTEAGLPDGVLNVVPSSSAGKTVGPLMSDPRLRKMSFTGSTEVGQTLMEQAAKNLLRISMELGGNAPFIVFADADLDAAIEGALIAKMRNNGESCVAANRFHVEAERRGGVLPSAGRPDGCVEGRSRRRRGRAGRTPHQRGAARQGRGAGVRRDRPRREGAHRRLAGRRAAATSTRRRCSPASRRRPGSCARRCSARSHR